MYGIFLVIEFGLFILGAEATEHAGVGLGDDAARSVGRGRDAQDHVGAFFFGVKGATDRDVITDLYTDTVDM